MPLRTIRSSALSFGGLTPPEVGFRERESTGDVAEQEEVETEKKGTLGSC